MWTAAAEPHVLAARLSPQRASTLACDLSRVRCCEWRHDGRRHIRIDLPDGVLRLDLGDGETAAEAMCIEPTVDLLRPLEPQFASIRRLQELYIGALSPVHDQRFVRLVEALRTADAIAAGASLRELALGILGDDWPGDGEYLKSRARRRVRLAEELTRVGPRSVLALTF